MTAALDLLSAALLLAGAFFFLAGTVGLLRFPDVFTRLHAVTKADTVGLGLVIASVAVESRSLTTALQLGLIWALVLLSSAVACQQIAWSATVQGAEPWRRS